MAMKLLFSRIREERKCTISLQYVVISLESESGFISDQILGIGTEMKSVVRSSVVPALNTPVRCVW